MGEDWDQCGGHVCGIHNGRNPDPLTTTCLSDWEKGRKTQKTCDAKSVNHPRQCRRFVCFQQAQKIQFPSSLLFVCIIQCGGGPGDIFSTLTGSWSFPGNAPG